MGLFSRKQNKHVFSQYDKSMAERRIGAAASSMVTKLKGAPRSEDMPSRPGLVSRARKALANSRSDVRREDRKSDIKIIQGDIQKNAYDLYEYLMGYYRHRFKSVSKQMTSMKEREDLQTVWKNMEKKAFDEWLRLLVGAVAPMIAEYNERHKSHKEDRKKQKEIKGETLFLNKAMDLTQSVVTFDNSVDHIDQSLTALGTLLDIVRTDIDIYDNLQKRRRNYHKRSMYFYDYARNNGSSNKQGDGSAHPTQEKINALRNKHFAQKSSLQNPQQQQSIPISTNQQNHAARQLQNPQIVPQLQRQPGPHQQPQPQPQQLIPISTNQQNDAARQLQNPQIVPQPQVQRPEKARRQPGPHQQPQQQNQQSTAPQSSIPQTQQQQLPRARSSVYVTPDENNTLPGTYTPPSAATFYGGIGHKAAAREAQVKH
jgi:hypothetical protein